MDIILSEKDLDNAVKLYLAFSGITRTVSALEYARKLKGDAAGISVSLVLDDDEMSAASLAELAMSQKRARGLTNQIDQLEAAKKPGKVEPVKQVADPAMDEDDGTPFTSATEDAALAKAEKAYPEPDFAKAETDEDEDPFSDAKVDAMADEEEELGNDDVPDNSPFAENEETTEEDDSGIAIVAPDEVEEDDPFGETVIPLGEEIDEEEMEAAEPVNLFG